MSNNWPATWQVPVNDALTLVLPLVADESGFSIYALDLMGRTEWNRAAARQLGMRLAAFDFDLVITAESKAIALAQELARATGGRDYVVLRKSRKLYMSDPVVVDVQSITTKAPQQFFLGSDAAALLKGKRVCVVDDVISTGGTMDAILKMAEAIGFTVAVIAVVLTEELQRTEYRGIPVLSLGHIPLPALSVYE